MKIFGLLAVASVLLVGIGFGTNAFGPVDDSNAKVNVEAGASDCSSDSGCSCCATVEDDKSEKPECTGSCSEGGACCQDASRSTLISTHAAPGGLIDESAVGTIANDTTDSTTTIVETVQEEQESVTAGDWSMWGGSIDRNMINNTTNVNLEFDLQAGTRVNWVANLGSQTYGNAIVAGGKVLVGCNNGAGYRADVHPAEQDKGCLICFDEESGEFLWQLTREKLTIGRVSDWPLQGICSTPAVELADSEEGMNRLWVVTNRCELVCLDLEGLENGNAGPFKEEVDTSNKDADIVWSLDMIEELGVFPHNLATSSPVVYGDMVYLLTSNGVDEAHLDLPSPRAPCFLAVNKNTGEVVWEANQPFDGVLHGQWASPTIGEVNGKAQVYFPGGDGWLYALDALTGEEVWKFDLNPKDSVWELGGKGSRNAVIATAVFKDNSVIIAVGQDPEHGEGVGHLWRIDATKTGDISSELGEIGSPGTPNPNSGVIWHYGGMDDSHPRPKPLFRRTMSTVSVIDGMVFAVDLSGFVHCLDYESGQRYWEEDLLTGVWGSTMVVDGKVFLGTEDGTLFVYEADNSKAKLLKQYDTINNSSIYSTPTIANGKMFLTDRTRLYSVNIQDDAEGNNEKEEK